MKQSKKTDTFSFVVDVGNSHTVLGIFKGDKVVDHWRLTTRKETTSDEVMNRIGGLVRFSEIKPSTITHVGLSTVVPAHERPWIKALQTLKENPDTASKRIALIAGGVDKECSLDEAIPFLKASVCGVFLIGRCAQRLHASWGRHVKTHLCPSMAEAVRQAYASIPEGGIVLLSPACASQDMYHDYAERGDDFKASSMKLTTG